MHQVLASDPHLWLSHEATSEQCNLYLKEVFLNTILLWKAGYGTLTTPGQLANAPLGHCSSSQSWPQLPCMAVITAKRQVACSTFQEVHWTMRSSRQATAMYDCLLSPVNIVTHSPLLLLLLLLFTSIDLLCCRCCCLHSAAARRAGPHPHRLSSRQHRPPGVGPTLDRRASCWQQQQRPQPGHVALRGHRPLQPSEGFHTAA